MIGQNLYRDTLSPASLIINQENKNVDLESNQNPLLEGDSSKSWRGGGPQDLDLLGSTAQELCLVEHHHDPEHNDHENSVKDHEKFSPSLPSRVHPSDFSTPTCHNCYCKSSSKNNCWRRKLQPHCSNPSEILSKYQCQSHQKISILEEVLSWRRTPCDFAETLQTQVLHPYKERPRKTTTLLQSIAPYCLSFKYILFILSLGMNQFYFLQFHIANLACNLEMINCFEIQEFWNDSIPCSVPSLVIASESPDRECCDGPVYKLDPPGSGHHNLYPSYNYPPPEVPDFPEYGPHEQMPPRVPGYGPGIVFDEKLDQEKKILCLINL